MANKKRTPEELAEFRDLGSISWREADKQLRKPPGLWLQNPTADMLNKDGYSGAYSDGRSKTFGSVLYDREYVITWAVKRLLHPLRLTGNLDASSLAVLDGLFPDIRTAALSYTPPTRAMGEVDKVEREARRISQSLNIPYEKAYNMLAEAAGTPEAVDEEAEDESGDEDQSERDQDQGEGDEDSGEDSEDTPIAAQVAPNGNGNSNAKAPIDVAIPASVPTTQPTKAAPVTVGAKTNQLPLPF